MQTLWVDAGVCVCVCVCVCASVINIVSVKGFVPNLCVHEGSVCGCGCGSVRASAMNTRCVGNCKRGQVGHVSA